MTWGAVAVAGATVVTGYMSQQQQAQAQADANRANMGMSKREVQERQRQFNLGGLKDEETQRQMLERLAPFMGSGTAAQDEMSALLGLSGKEAGEEAQARYSDSPGQVFLRDQQEKASLRNLSATGGLRGGGAQRRLQEEAYGRAQTNRDQYLRQLSTVAGRGQQASSLAISDTDLFGEEKRNAADAATAAAAKAAEDERRRKAAAARAAAAYKTQGAEDGGAGGTPEGGGGGNQGAYT